MERWLALRVGLEQTLIQADFGADFWLALVIPAIVGVWIVVFRKLTFRGAPQLTFHVRDRKRTDLPAIAVSTMTVWNSGPSTIELGSFAKADPLRIGIEGSSTLYGTHLTRVSRTSSAVKLGRADPDGQIVDLDFLSPGDGFRIVAEHSSKSARLVLLGTVKGGRVARHHPLPMLYKTGAVLLFVGGSFEPAMTLWGLITHEGFSSVWLWSFLPIPLLMMIAAVFLASGLVGIWLDKGSRLVKQWDDEEGQEGNSEGIATQVAGERTQ